MKNSLLTIFMLSVALLQAGIEPVVTGTSNKSIRIAFEKTNTEEVFVRLKDDEGVVLYSLQIDPQVEKGKILNLSNLPSGNYDLEVEDGQTITDLDIRLSDDRAIVASKDITYKPQIAITQDRLSFNILSLGRAVTAVIMLDETEVFQKVYENNSTLSKVYDISALPNGEYTFKMVVGEHVVYKTFRI